MRPALLFLAALVLNACVPPDDDAAADLLPDPVETPAPSAFEASRWLEETAALDTLSDLDERDARSRDLAAQLDAVTSWTQECDLDEPSGQLYLHDLGDGHTVVEALCFRAAYQANAVLVHLSSNDARVLRLPVYDESGALTEPEATTYGGYLSTEEAEPGMFDLIALARGAGDCGSMTRYRLEGDRVEAVQVQARRCDTPCPNGPCNVPAVWPLVYSHPAS